MASLPASFQHAILWNAAYLFKSECHKLQDVPLSYGHDAALWGSLLLSHLHEETRAQLQQALARPEQLVWTSCYLETRYVRSLAGGLASIPLSEAGNTVKTTDIAVLARSPVRDCASWQQETLCYVESVRESGGAETRVVLSAPEGSWMHHELQSEQADRNPWSIAVIGSGATGGRIWSALAEAMDCLQPSPLLLRVLAADPAQFRCLLSAQICDSDSDSSSSSEREESDVCTDLNPSQQAAVQQAVAGSSMKGKDCAGNILLVQGPPGTGKTSTIVVMLSELATRSSVLLCAPTNMAVAEVATRFISPLLKVTELTGGKKGACTLGDIVLLASEDRIAPDSMLDKVWSASRARRLLGVLNGQTLLCEGRNLCSLLESAPALHAEYLDTFSDEAELEGDQGGSRQFLSLWAWLDVRLQEACTKASSAACTLCDDLPSVLLESGAWSELKSLQRSLGQLLGAWREMGRQNRQEVEELVECLAADSTASIDTADANKHAFLAAARDLLPHRFRARLVLKQQQQLTQYTLEQICLACATAVFSTVASAGRPILQRSRSLEWASKQRDRVLASVAKRGFGACIIDEACQLVEAETAIILQLLCLVGDFQQLEATVISPCASAKGYGRSLFERLYTRGVHVHMLDTQYRMHPAISMFPAATFYHNKLKDGPNVLRGRPGSALLAKSSVFNKIGPYAFVDVPLGREAMERGSSSFFNEIEAQCVAAVVRSLRSVADDGGPTLLASPLSVGVIAPYTAQVRLISGILNIQPSSRATAASNPVPMTWEGDSLNVQIGSVDGFQGMEVDVLIFCTVRASSSKGIGFVKKPNRQNVAITRGRHAVWVFGRKETLKSSQEWISLIEDADGRGLLFEADEVDLLQKAVKQAQRQLRFREDVLDPAKDMFKDCVWKLVFSFEWKEQLAQLSDRHEKAKVLKECHSLACGLRAPGYPSSVSCNLAAIEFKDLIHVTQIFSDLFLIWHIDVDRDPTCCRQIIKLWGLMKRANVYTFIKRLEAGLRQYSSKYISIWLECERKVSL